MTTFCPFCGSQTNEICSDKDSHGMFYYWFCNDCEACGPTERTPEKALERWQSRVTEPADPEPRSDYVDY
jgi:Lar family restriction alleviation protein